MHISMIPRGETGKAIHISQDDTNREVEFIPYDQNGLVKTTSDETVAHINSIKGNTISFNQLVPVSTVATQTINNVVCTNNNDGSWKLVGTASATVFLTILNNVPLIANHKYYFYGLNKIYPDGESVALSIRDGGNILANTYGEPILFTPTQNYSVDSIIIRVGNGTQANDVVTPQLHDLTLMGIDNLTTTTEIEQWLSSHICDIPYYGYTLGKLLPFKGTKLVASADDIGGAFDYENYDRLDYLQSTGTQYIDTDIKAQGSLRIDADFKFNELGDGALFGGRNTNYTNYFIFASDPSNNLISSYNQEINNVGSTDLLRHTVSKRKGTTYIDNVSKATVTDSDFVSSSNVFIYARSHGGTAQALCKANIYSLKIYENDVLVRNFIPAKRKTDNVLGLFDIVYQTFYTNSGSGTFYYGEVISVSVLSLPTLDYFPTGMKSAGSVYDELTPSKATTRIGSVDLGTLNWDKLSDSQGNWFTSTTALSNVKTPTTTTENPNGICSIYDVAPYSPTFAERTNNTLIIIFSSSSYAGHIWIIDNDYTDATAFKQMLTNQNAKLYYELATPTSTDISLDLTYPVWNNGTEQLLPVNTSTPTTTPIIANITYPDRTEDTEFLYKQTSFVFIPRTWAFVCKNITQALTLVGNVLKGTIPSGMTSESGKFPLKLKMTDEDGDVYSEKIDLIVEKKP